MASRPDQHVHAGQDIFPLVHPAIHNANLSAAVIMGDPVCLTTAHAKVRRNGYPLRRT
jgi:hypothetical protein